jgi:hypothetical protein
MAAFAKVGGGKDQTQVMIYGPRTGKCPNSEASVDATTYPLLQYDQLMPGRHVLCFKSTLRLERRDQEGKKQSSAIIAAGVGRFSYRMNTDEPFCPHSAWKKAMLPLVSAT